MAKDNRSFAKALTVLRRCSLNANQLKIIALIFMTIDHVGAYMFELPFVATHVEVIRIIGRIAAPLFLFTVVESARHTSNRVHYILRLYVASLIMAGAGIISNTFFEPVLGHHGFPNIFQTLMFTVLVIHLIDNIIKAIREKNPKPLIQSGIIVVLILGSILIFNATLGNANFLPYSFDFFGFEASEIRTLISAVFPNILTAEYTPLFILLGVLWYYTRNRIVQMIIFFVFVLISRYNVLSEVPYLDWFSAINQHWMVLATPLILLYNGEKGGSMKYFFYAYYILHPFVLILLNILLR
jgi:hypothetical protein